MPYIESPPPFYGLRAANVHGVGLGDATEIATGAAQIGGTVAMASSKGIATALGVSVPIVGAAIAGVMVALGAWLNRKGPKQKEATTRFVNDAEPILVQNLQTFLSGPRTQGDKDFALAVFDKVWGEVVVACGQASMGNPGQACIADRRAGACEWKEGGECWNWFVGYRDPIAASPVNSEASVLTGQLSSLTGGMDTTILAGIALVAIAGLGILFGKGK